MSTTVDTKQCPFCKETVHIDATVCKHCHRNIKEKPPARRKSPAEIVASLIICGLALSFILYCVYTWWGVSR